MFPRTRFRTSSPRNGFAVIAEERALARVSKDGRESGVAAILRDACFASSSSDNGEAVAQG